jgi:hypothetical protein
MTTKNIEATENEQTAEQSHAAEMRALELKDKQLEVRLKEANLIDSQERLSERELKRAEKGMTAKLNGETLKATNKVIAGVQAKCNHRKGGNGLRGIVTGEGDSPQYAILKHTFAAGNVEVRCLRCHKAWKKPLKANYPVLEDYNAALVEYNMALAFPTNNTASSSVSFGYSDNGEFYRTQTQNSL